MNMQSLRRIGKGAANVVAEQHNKEGEGNLTGKRNTSTEGKVNMYSRRSLAYSVRTVMVGITGFCISSLFYVGYAQSVLRSSR